MPYPEKNPLSAKDYLYLATSAAEEIIEIETNTRTGRKINSHDTRYSLAEAKHRRESIAKFIGSMRPGVAYLAYEWADDKNLRNQISGNKDPIKFHSADNDAFLDAYADMLALTAQAVNRQTQGRFGGIVLYGRPNSSTNDIVLQYRFATAPRSE